MTLHQAVRAKIALMAKPAPVRAVGSVAKVLGAVLACLKPVHDCLAMVKPQFEVGRERVGKGGVVRDPALRRSALCAVAGAAAALGASVLGFAGSSSLMVRQISS